MVRYRMRGKEGGLCHSLTEYLLIDRKDRIDEVDVVMRMRVASRTSLANSESLESNGTTNRRKGFSRAQ